MTVSNPQVTVKFSDREVTAIIYKMLGLYNPIDNVFQEKYIAILWFLYTSLELANESDSITSLKDFRRVGKKKRHLMVYNTVRNMIKKGIDLQDEINQALYPATPAESIAPGPVSFGGVSND